MTGGVIGRVGVVGAGTMGAGIAAQVANAGVPVVLLDIVPGATRRAVGVLLKADPPAFMHRRQARLVETGDLEADLTGLADCDWIIEAIVERPEAKRALFTRLEAVRRDGSCVSSNTSTIQRATLVAGMPARFRADFMITHFFNPPRFMRLLEVVAGPETLPERVAAVRAFADHRLGKTVIDCADTPGFIANRIGTLWMAAAMRHAIDLGLTVEEADAVAGKPFGVPPTGIFGLMDLVGLDLLPHIAESLLAALPEDDPYRAVQPNETLLARLIAEGRTGRKGNGGFYSVRREGAGRVRLAVDLASGEYRPLLPPRLDSLAAHAGDLRALAAHPDRGGRYARAVLLDTLAYAASLVPDIAGSIDAVDAAMRLGYGWRLGPFELIDAVGPAWLAEALRADGRAVPALLERVGEGRFYRVRDGRHQALAPSGEYRALPRPPGVLLLSDVRCAGEPLASNASASLWRIGDGVACLELHADTLDAAVLALLRRAVALGVEGAFRALVLTNEGRNFSLGADFSPVLAAGRKTAWGEIEAMVTAGQQAFRALRAAPFPVVGAAAGLALGAGCELLLQCDAVQAHADLGMGFTQAGLGLVPTWGGSAALLARLSADPTLPKGPMPKVVRAFEVIATASVSRSALEAREKGLLRREDGITFNRDRLLADARQRACALAEGYAAPAPLALRLPGPSGAAALRFAVEGEMRLGRATPHDALVADHLARVLTGGAADATEETPLERIDDCEREAVLALARQAPTLARIEHMLATGRLLRN